MSVQTYPELFDEYIDTDSRKSESEQETISNFGDKYLFIAQTDAYGGSPKSEQPLLFKRKDGKARFMLFEDSVHGMTAIVKLYDHKQSEHDSMRYNKRDNKYNFYDDVGYKNASIMLIELIDDIDSYLGIHYVMNYRPFIQISYAQETLGNLYYFGLSNWRSIKKKLIETMDKDVEYEHRLDASVMSEI